MRTPPRPAARALAAAFIVAVVAAASSCRDVVTDDVVDAGAALCGSFDACDVERAACTHVGEYFANGDDESFADYLDYYVEWSCGEGCGTVEVCLDYVDLCRDKRSTCEADFQCCNASTGAAACEGGKCCYDLGVVCEGPEDCCPLDDGTPVGCFARQEGGATTCGGFDECKLRGKECDEQDDDCCGTATCRGGKCEVVTCVERDAPCRGSDDCCNDEDTCREGTCKPPDVACDEPDELQAPPCCNAIDALCLEGGATPCCGGAICTPTINDLAVCRPPNECGPPGTPCEVDEDCCGNGTDSIGCVGVGNEGEGSRVCGPIGCQLAQGAPCGANGLGCCTGLVCLGGDGGEPGSCEIACESRECGRTILEFGAPLDPSCPYENPAESECLNAICDADPFCCCARWDDDCVAAAVACLDPAPDGGNPDGG